MPRRKPLPASFLLFLVVLCLRSAAPAQERPRTSPVDLERKLAITPQKEYHAVLMRALTWLTGNAEANDYVSVGRLANSFGFVRLRVASAHSLSRGAVGQATYELLDARQRQWLVELVDEQWPALDRCKAARVAINRELEGLLVGRSSSARAIETLGAEFGRLEAELAAYHGEGFSRIAATLTEAQRAALADLRVRALAGGLGQYRLGDEDKRDLRQRLGEGSALRTQEFWNLASRLCSWLTGTQVDNDYDTVGKPSQHFGDVDLRIESGHGATRGGTAAEVENLLTAEQKARLRAVVDENAEDFAAYAAARASVDRCLEQGLQQKPIDWNVVREKGRDQGLAEARMTWRHAEAFLALRESLDGKQREAFVALRKRFVIPAGGEDGAVAEGGAPESLDGEKLVLAGQRVFALCALCHAPKAGRGIGPSLTGVVGRRVAAVPGQAYSPAMQARGAADETWTEERLDAFLAAPQRHTPGTYMAFTGLESKEQRRAVIAFLQSLDAGETKSPSTAPQRQEPARERARQAPSKPSQPGTRSAATTRAPASVRSPNFVFVQFEGTGAGFASLSFAQDDRLPDAKGPAGLTPNLAALAQDGMRFSDFYVSAPRCTPARATFLTGIGAAKLRMTYVNEGGQERRGGEGGGSGGGRGRRAESDEDAPTPSTKLLPPRSVGELPDAVKTVAEVLKEKGYATAHFGKWHVGRRDPSAHGFDEHDGPNTNQGPGRNRKPNPEEAVEITARGLAFAKAQKAAGNPFYLQISHYGGGSEEETRPETRQALADQLRAGRGKSQWQAMILHDIDAAVGDLLAGLRGLGLEDDTYVIVSFDHGMAGREANAPLSGGKGSVREGGVRVPFLVRGPGVAKNVCSHVRGSAADLLPTIADLAGANVPDGVEGGSLRAVLMKDGKCEVARAREEFVVHFPHYDLQNGGPASAIWLGTHKLIRCYEDGSVRLYDLARDPGEREDLAQREPARRKELEQRLDEYLKAIDAAMPTPNLDYRK